MRATDRYRGPACGHSACRSNWIETGEVQCVQAWAARNLQRITDPPAPVTNAERIAMERQRRRTASRARAVAIALGVLGALAVCFWLGAAVGLSLWGRP